MRTGSMAIVLVSACSGGRTDWATKPLAAVNDTVGNVAFTIELPGGLVEGEVLSPASQRRWQASAAAGHEWPAFTVELPTGVMTFGKPTLQEAAGYDAIKGTTVVRKEAIAGGFIVSTVRDDRRMVSIDLVKTFGDTMIGCRAGAETPDGGPASSTRR